MERLVPPARSSPGDTRPTQQKRNASRAVALFVLVPAVPMMLLSVLALAAFYLKPDRFTALLERLPGTEFLRVALIFAPATLFGVVLLAALYALEPTAPRRAEPVQPMRAGMPAGRLLASVALAVSLPLLLLSAGGWVLSFVAPGRFALLTEPLPGTDLLKSALPFLPFIFLATSAGAVLVLARGSSRRPLHAPDVTRWSVRLVLLAALPLLALTLGGLFLLYAQPEWGERLVGKLGVMAFVKLALVFGPAVLIALVVLASLYLARPRIHGGPPAEKAVQSQDALSARRAAWSSWAFAAALAAISMMALGVTLAVIYLLLR
jgi:hypothetical protein